MTMRLPKSPKTFILAALALPILAAPPASAQALGAVSQVLQLRESTPQDVVILRRTGAVQVARTYDWLMPGDRIQVKGAGAAATVFDIAAHRSVRVMVTDGPKAIGGTPPGGYSQAADDFFQGFSTLFNTPRRPIAVETQARGADISPPLLVDALLPSGPQSLPRGQAGLALFWRGAAGQVTLAVTGGAVVAQAPASTYASAVLPTPPLDGAYGLSVGSATLNWSVTTVDAASVPEPPWMLGGHSASDPERVVRAAWILRGGPVRWRLFAASELAALSDRNYAAERLWQALQSGEFFGAAGLPSPVPPS